MDFSIITDALQTAIASFDLSFCIAVNILTYLSIKLIDELNGDKVVSVWGKRGVLLLAIAILAPIYYYAGVEFKLLVNSSILAPVFWSWIIKPLCKKFDIDYKQINY